MKLDVAQFTGLIEFRDCGVGAAKLTQLKTMDKEPICWATAVQIA